MIDHRPTNLLMLAFGCLFLAQVSESQTIHVSVGANGVSGNGISSSPSVTEEGQYIAFASEASNLVTGDTNQVSDIFLHYQEDIQPIHLPNGARETSRVSVSTSGAEANGASISPWISADTGRFVVFASSASNLVANDSNGKIDIFLRDRTNSQTYLISTPLDLSGNVTGESDGDSYTPQVSPDGCYIVFASDASNLNAQNSSGTAINDINGKRDVFLYFNPLGEGGCLSSLTYPQLYMLSLGPSDALANGDSYNPSFGDSRYISFTSVATNLVSADSNGVADIFVRDRALSIGDGATTILVSKSSDGTLSNGASYSSSMESNRVTFDSDGSNLVSNDRNAKRDIFSHILNGDRSQGTTQRVSVTVEGVEGNGDSFSPQYAAGNNYIAFASDATNLSDRTDCNSATDIFVRDYLLNTLRRMNLSTAGYQAGKGLNSGAPAIARGGILVAYPSLGLLVPSDTNSAQDIYGSVASQNPNEQERELQKGRELEEPPEVCVEKRTAGTFLEKFNSVSSSGVLRKSGGKAQFLCRGGTICYSVEAVPLKTNGKRDKGRDIIRKNSKRNELALKNLKPGNYEISFRVTGKSGQKLIRSSESPPTVITVNKEK